MKRNVICVKCGINVRRAFGDIDEMRRTIDCAWMIRYQHMEREFAAKMETADHNAGNGSAKLKCVESRGKQR